MGKLEYDHGLVYLLKDTTQSFHLHATAQLTDETKARHSRPRQDGYVCGLQVSLEPEEATVSVSTGLLGSNIESVTLEQVLKVTGHKEQTGNEFAVVEWFYCARKAESNEIPCQVHRIKFIVLGDAEEEIIEDGEIRLSIGGGELLIPEGVGSGRTPGNPEQMFYRLALKLVDKSGNMLKDFHRALGNSARGRIVWSEISALGGAFPRESPLSYFEANNQIFHKIRIQFFHGQITYSNINDLLSVIDNVIQKREEDFERFCMHKSFAKKSHRHVINFWKDNRKMLVNLLHYIDIQSEIRKNESCIIRDDLAIGITDTDFEQQSSLQHYAEDMIARLIIPTFLLVILWYFWSR